MVSRTAMFSVKVVEETMDRTYKIWFSNETLSKELKPLFFLFQSLIGFFHLYLFMKKSLNTLGKRCYNAQEL